MVKHILVCDPLEPSALELLKRQQKIDVHYQPDISPEELKKTIATYDAVIVRSRTTLRRDTLERATRLKVIGRAGTGLDNIDVDFARERGIQVLNTPGANANAVAELTLILMLMLARNIVPALDSLKAGKPLKVKGIELQGKTLGLIGFGNIGRLVAQLARGFGMGVLAHDPLIDPNQIPEALRVVPLCSLDELLSQSNFVSLHVPLLESTRQLVNEGLLERFKRGAYLVNTARADLIDDAAVLKALEAGQLAGYATDVHEAGEPLLAHRKVIATPHIGASTGEAQRRAGEEIAALVLAALPDQNGDL